MSVLTRGRSQPRQVVPARTHDGQRVLRLAVAGAGRYRGIGVTAVLAGGAGVSSVSLAAAVVAAVAWGGVLVWDGGSRSERGCGTRVVRRGSNPRSGRGPWWS